MDIILALTLYALWRTRVFWLPLSGDPNWDRLQIHEWPMDHFNPGLARDQGNGKNYWLKSYAPEQELEIQNHFEEYGKSSGLWPVRSLSGHGQHYLLFEEHPGISLNVLIRELRANQANITLDLAFKIMIEATRKWGTLENGPFWGRGLSPHLIYFGPTGTYLNMWGWPISHQSLVKIEHQSVAHYLAPEIRSGTSGAHFSADIFSLGAIFYELLVLVPWNQNQATLSLLQGKIVHPSSVRQGIGQRLDQFILKCLSFDPSDRFEGHYSFIQFLENLADREAPNWRELELEVILGRYGHQFWDDWAQKGSQSLEEDLPQNYKKAA